MKLVSYLKDEHDQLAVLVDGLLYDMERLPSGPAKYHEHVFKLLGRIFSCSAEGVLMIEKEGLQKEKVYP
jgi:hypothetical protein